MAPAPNPQRMKITDHIIEGVKFKQTPNVWQLPLVAPENLIIHYSMSGNVPGTVAHLTNPKSQVSAHIVIGRDGEVWQLARFDQRAWHAGQSEWKGKKSRNYYDIGIEFVNWGPVEKDKDGKFWTKWRQEVPADEVIEATHKNEASPRYWQKFTPEQLAKGAEVARAILEAYTSIEMILGHDDIAPTRKTDPGPLFPMNQFLIDCGFMDAPELEYPTVHNSRYAHFERFEDEIMITMADDGGDEVSDYMTLDEARALRDWLTKILPE